MNRDQSYIHRWRQITSECEYIWISVFMKKGTDRGKCSYPTVEEPAADVQGWAGWGRPPRWPPRDAEGTSAHLVKENMTYRHRPKLLCWCILNDVEIYPTNLYYLFPGTTPIFVFCIKLAKLCAWRQREVCRRRQNICTQWH